MNDTVGATVLFGLLHMLDNDECLLHVRMHACMIRVEVLNGPERNGAVHGTKLMEQARRVDEGGERRNDDFEVGVRRADELFGRTMPAGTEEVSIIEAAGSGYRRAS